jgi:hypothetical protein
MYFTTGKSFVAYEGMTTGNSAMIVGSNTNNNNNNNNDENGNDNYNDNDNNGQINGYGPDGLPMKKTGNHHSNYYTNYCKYIIVKNEINIIPFIFIVYNNKNEYRFRNKQVLHQQYLFSG